MHFFCKYEGRDKHRGNALRSGAQKDYILLYYDLFIIACKVCKGPYKSSKVKT